ncbi:MAG TPA: ArsR family transcriptional regulator [Thermoplasmata archaeon]
MGSNELARHLFEIASDERLGILSAIAEKPLKHAQIARHLDLTGSETTRHLTRLVSVGLVSKNPRSEYGPTNLARLLSVGIPFFDFLATHRDFLLSHDVLVLPREFVERLGALSQGSFTSGTYKVVAFQEQSLRAVKRRTWVMSEHAFEQGIPILQEKASSGADVRVIRPRGGFEEVVPALSGASRNYPVRLLDETRIFLAVLDDIAGVCFPALDGKVDMSTMLLLQDPSGYRWAADLFLYFWERARERLG